MVRFSSGVLAGDVSVTIRAVPTGVIATVRTDAAGSYRLPDLPPGTYSIRVQAPGFQAFVQADLAVEAGQVLRQDVLLRPLAPRARQSALVGNTMDFDSIPSRAGRRLRHESDAAPGPSGQFPSPSQVQEPSDPVVEARRVQGAANSTPASSRGFLASPAKRGTNEFHGALYHSLENDAFNARGFFGEKAQSRRNNAGAFVGGPILKDRTFFAYHYDRLSVRSGAQSGFGNSVPVQAFRNGDFGRLLTDRVAGIDALGRPVRRGQVFDPASTGTVRGVPVRDAFANNTIPAAHPQRSAVAARVQAFAAEPQRPGLEFNVQGNPFGEQIWVLDAPSHFVRLDHSFTRSVRSSVSLSRASHPAVRNCGGVGGCRSTGDPVESPESNTGYIGTGFYEDITTHHVRQKLDWTATPSLLNQTTVSYDEFHALGHPLSAGGGWQDRLWGSGGNGLPASDAGPPALSFTGNTRYSPLGTERGGEGFLANHYYSVSNSLTWVRTRHTVSLSGELRHHRYAFRGWANNVAGSFNFHRGHTGGFDAAGNNLTSTGDPFASFLLGQVNSTRFQIPDSPTIHENLVSWSIVDAYRVTPDLTVTLGFRFDYQSAIRERHDNMSTFDPNVPNPGASGRLGAMIFAGSGPGRIGTRTLETPPSDAFGPRIGFAYRVGERNVVRGGYGIYYASVPHAQSESVNTFGFRFHATAKDLSNGRRPAYFLDDGFPRSNIALPPSLDPAIGNNTSPVAVTRDRATLPRVQQWSLTIRRQVARTASIDLSYRGNRATRLTADRRILGPAANANANSVLALGPSLLSSRAGSDAMAAGVEMPYRGFDRSVAQALRPFPHMLDIGYLNVPAGNSFYHALLSNVEKRFSDGVHFRATYVWSKSTGMGAGRPAVSDGLGHGPQNPSDTHSLERGLSVEDVPHRILAAFTHEVPFFRDRKTGLAAKVLGGWSVAGTLRIESAAPVNVVMANDLVPFLFNGQKRPDVLSDSVRIRHAESFDAASDSVFNRAAFGDPGPLRFGNASRTMNFVRGFGYTSEDFSFYKDTWIGQKLKLRFETQLANALNRVVLCEPNRNWSAASFGRAFSQCNSPRSIRFGLKLDF